MSDSFNCSNCGAKVTGIKCPYCHSATGIKIEHRDFEFPLADFEQVNFTSYDFSYYVVLTFGISVVLIGILFLFITAFNLNYSLYYCIPIFMVTSIVLFLIILTFFSKYFFVKIKGRKIKAIVLGYIKEGDEDHYCNKLVKLKVYINDEYKLVLYRIGKVREPFLINSQVIIKEYKNMFIVENKKKYYFE